MKRFIIFSLACLLVVQVFGQSLRAPSVPLVAHDPYFSIWSPADRLYDRNTTHWTGRQQTLSSIVRIDGKAYKIMGEQPGNLEPMRQTKVEITPTRTLYKFQNNQVEIALTFTTPALPNNLDVLSRPLTYISWTVKAIDSREHDVQVLFACGSEIAVNNTDQQITWETPVIEGFAAIKLFNPEQPILEKTGDDLRIDWGYAYLSVPAAQSAKIAVGEREKTLREFVSSGTVVDANLSKPRRVNESWASMFAVWNIGKVNTTGSNVWTMLSYDDIKAIKYFDSQLPAWWKRNGATMEQLIPIAAREFDNLSKECIKFDTELMTDLDKVGGSKYATMCALAYRQCLAAHKLVADAKGMPLIFSKENFSNGCIATVDVIYPAAPFLILFSKALTKAMLQPNLDYAASKRWKFPFAPHDLGTYPQACGQAYGGGEDTEDNQMPVEESGNMIIMIAALAKMEGNADYAKANWPVIEKWCEYLLSKGFDPENQLCTDDFAGHLAHNINLSAKAIVAIGCYAQLCDQLGKKEKAAEIRQKAKTMAAEWIKQATEGDHTRLAYDRPNTWSQKYNLVWDKILGLNLFPKELYEKEIAFYKTKMGDFGLPLDSRERYTKNDWITWTATLASNKSDFQMLFDPIYTFANYTPQRVPLSDWYNTDNGNMTGFQARSVVGGFFIKMLDDKALWAKWVSKGTDATGPWAPLKFFEFSKTILAPSTDKGFDWKYTINAPANDWFKVEYTDQSWTTGTAGFGSDANARTKWNSSDIWMRKTFDVAEVSDKKIAVSTKHDEDVEIYVNGVLIVSLTGYTGNYAIVTTDKKVNEVLHTGTNTIAVHCHQTNGGQFIDAALYEY